MVIAPVRPAVVQQLLISRCVSGQIGLKAYISGPPLWPATADPATDPLFYLAPRIATR